jgi:DNA-binding protein YbaB
VTLRDRLRDATEVATSPDGLVTATVGGRGELVGLELDERVVDRDDVGWLADLIVKTAAAAFEQVDRS